MIFPLLEAAKVMLYRLDWQGLPVIMRNTVKSTLAVVDISITCQQTSLHKTKQSSQVGTLAHASSGKLLHALQCIFNKRASGLCTLGFMEASVVMSSSQKQNHGLQKQSVRQRHRQLQCWIDFKNLTKKGEKDYSRIAVKMLFRCRNGFALLHFRPFFLPLSTAVFSPLAPINLFR